MQTLVEGKKMVMEKLIGFKSDLRSLHNQNRPTLWYSVHIDFFGLALILLCLK